MNDMRILVVEDERRIARAIKEGLEQESYAVDIVHDGDLRERSDFRRHLRRVEPGVRPDHRDLRTIDPWQNIGGHSPRRDQAEE